MNKYEVIEPLGEGSFGRVYKAVKLSTKTFVALKVISKRGRSIKEVKGLRRECEIQRRLDHPNIIKMLDSFETDNEIVVITEFAHKELNTILDKEGILPENKVQPIVWDLVSALYYLHSHRVLHRDLKPQNILIDSENRAKLCDFGFARNMSTGTHVLTSIKGTPLYMAPELIDEQPYDHNADLWSLGCIIYELLMGAPPFRTSSILHLIRLIRHEQIQWPTFLSEHFLSFLKGLLQKDPSKRLSWTEILNHAFVKGHILILEDNNADMPLTRVLSENTLQAKEQQKKDHVIHKVTQQLRLAEATSRTRSSPQNNETKKSETQDVKNNNVLPSPMCNKMSKLSLENKDNKKSAEKTTKSTANSKNEVLATSQLSGKGQKLNLIEDNHPIENEEWIVFLQKSMEEIIAGETLSLTQPNLANIIVSPLRNSHANPKVLSYVVKSFSLPFAMKGISAETLENIKKTYLEVKLVPNLIYSSKLLLRVRDETANPSPSPANTPSPTPVRYRKITELTEKDLHCLEYTYMLITHLVHLDNDFLSQLCDAIVVLNVYGLLRLFLLICKNKLQLVMDLIAILTHLMRVFPENVEILERILLSDEEKQVNFVELLRHNEPMLRERTCFFLMFLGKNLTSTKMKSIWNDTVRETVEALMYDSIESVRNAADRTVDELKGKEFYKPTKT